MPRDTHLQTQPHALMPAPTPQVAASKAVAEASIDQLRAALQDARHATVARATALADALGVNPPRNLLARRVSNEHRERLSARDVTAGGCTYRSSSLPMSPQPVAEGRGGSGEAVRAPPPSCDTVATAAKKSVGDSQLPWAAPTEPVCPYRRTPPSSPKQEPSVTCSLDNPRSITNPAPPRESVSQASPRTHPTAAKGARGGRVEIRQPSSPPSPGGGLSLGWNRKWCRSVDAWCRNASARFRTRLAEEVVRSARRLHWLAGSGRDCGRCAHGDGDCVSVPGGSAGLCNCGAGSLGTGAAERTNATSRFTPSKTIGTEGWAALAAFGNVADLLEIVGSTAELVVSIKVYSTEQRQQQLLQLQQQIVEEVVTVSEEKEVLGPPNPVGSDEKNSFAASLQEKRLDSDDENKFSPPIGDEISRSLSTRNDSTDAASSRQEEEIVIENGRQIHPNGMGGDNTSHMDDVSLEGEGYVTPEDTKRRASKHPHAFDEVDKTRQGVGLGRHRPAASRSTLAAVSEEGDTDIESSSSNDTEEEREEDDKEEEANAISVSSPNDSRHFDADTGDALPVDTQTAKDYRLEAGVDEAGEEDLSSTGGGSSRSNGSASVARGSKRPLATARITLGPATVETCLGIRPLSAFVMGACRQTQRLGYEKFSRPAGIGAHGPNGRPHTLGRTTTGAPSPPGTDQESVAKRRGLKINSASNIDSSNEKGPRAIGPSTAANQPQSPVDGVQLFSKPKSPSMNGIAAACTISHTEKLGLACAVETLVLPFLRINSSSKRQKNPSTSGKAPPIRLCINMPVGTGGKVSEPVDIRIQTPSPAPPTAQHPASTSPSPAAAAAAAAAAVQAAPTSADSSQTIEERIVCATRYIESPIQHWVGRVDGRRCLLSSSAASSANHLPDSSGRRVARILGQQLTGREGSPQNRGKARDCTRCVFAVLRPDRTTSVGDSQSSFEPQQRQGMFVVGRLPSAGSMPSMHDSPISSNVSSEALGVSIGRSLGRPLCRNCGRRALQRLLVNTNLLAEGSLGFPLKFPLLSSIDGPRNTEYCDLPASERVRLVLTRRGRGIARSGTTCGKLADWVCSSGAVLCNTCLRSLQSADVAVKRL